MTDMSTATSFDAEAFYDDFSRKHDIDDYYVRANFLIRFVEQSRMRCIRRMIRAKPEDHILEVGCGGGHILKLFPSSQLTGLDVSGCMLEKARKNLTGYHVQLLKGEMHELDLSDQSFDKVICSEVLEHVENPVAILSQIRRVLKPGGIAVITLPNDNMIRQIQSVIRYSGLSKLPVFNRVAWGGDEYHLHSWKVREMRAMISSHLTVAQQRSIPTPLMPIRYAFKCTTSQ